VHERTHAGPLRVVVTLGTIPYAFGSLVARLRAILPDDSEVLWQTGETSTDGLPGTAHATMPHAELVEAMRAADVVISHAGVGSALDALEAGRLPLLVPREQRAGEHIDDHQSQIASLLASRGLAITARADELSLEHLTAAAGGSVTTAPATRPLVLH
jgi:UDP-N-acetylglucosamine transferase subunit ALG13